MTRGSKTSWISQMLLCSMLCMWTTVDSWSYFYSNDTMNWEDARSWCRENYTDMVAIQNQDEIGHLNTWLPRQPFYYWIGIRKINNVWTWVGTNKALTAEATNWAKGEPNGKRQGSKQSEDCVEMYIKREKEPTKWNDEMCWRKKTALCYSAACKKDSCDYGDCVETINSHTCACFEGFYGEKCEKVVKCDKEEITVPYKGSVNCTHKYGNFSFDSLCEYSCEEGYELSMVRPLRCTGSKEWSEQPPTCEAVQCPVLTRPEGGSMDCFSPLGDSRYQSTCVFACYEGFVQAGSSSDTLQCEASGSWNASQPSCVAITCQNPEGAPHLIPTCSSSSSELRLGSTCSFDCGAGFVLQGADTVLCSGDGRWSRAIPTCKEMECPAPEIPTSGRIFCSLPLSSPASPETPHPLGMVCNFTCDEGHKLEGAPSMECEDPGQWTSSPPTCTVVKCNNEEVTVPYKGSVNCTHKYGIFSFDSSCEYSCEEGYELSMVRPLRCTGSKEWSEQPPTCEAVQCPELTRPEGGSMDCFSPLGDSRYQSTCVFACDEGFVQAGSSSDTLQCEASGSWNASQPSCVAVQLPASPTLENGSVSCGPPDMKFIYRNTCSFSCGPGYHLVGLGTVTYTSAADWGENIPRCEAITCQNPEGAPHLIPTCSSSSSELRLGSTCSFDCGAGFVLQGADTVLCSGDGRWSRAIPTCKEMECPAPEIPTSGRIFCSLPLSSPASPETPHPLGMVCNFTCDEGHELEGAPSMECEDPGQWTSSPPTCTVVKCNKEEVTVPYKGSVNCTHKYGIFSFDSSCEYSCEEGYELSMVRPLRCTGSKEWSEQPPTCEAVQCPVLTRPEGGSMDCFSPLGDSRYQSTCVFACDEGFVQAGSSSDTLQCEASGSWNASQPSCVALRCPSLEAPENGHINCSNSESVFNTQCSFTCTPEYSLEGHELLNCDRHGNWTGERPTCQASPSKLSAITSGVAAGGTLLSGLSLAVWILKRLKQRNDTFELSSNSDIEAPPQVYKNSLDSLI
ncbi:E-selectin isoform X2 [Limanda limanda]|uniref:E-selectin isoform X2 n=1 Tax=Limanda limanda TaxID=27771 RepID=UPI0029C6AB69|nr:E-selectin isoform X2 [Limanda limanda]